MRESASACPPALGITKHKFHILDETGKQALGIGAEDFSLGAFAKSRPVDRGLGAVGKGHAGVRVVSGEQPDVFTQLLDTMRDITLAGVDGVKQPSFGDHLGWFTLQMGHKIRL